MKEYAEKIKEILDSPNEEIDIDFAATLLLRLNRNQNLYRNIVRKNNYDKLRYELQKLYEFHIQEEALKETAEMEKTVKVLIEQKPEIVTIPETPQEGEILKGIRADHDQLPEEIKAKYIENFDLLRRMRKLHETLKLMINALPCDRYPFLKEMLDCDETLRANWKEYDDYVIVPTTPSEPKEVETKTKAKSTNTKNK